MPFGVDEAGKGPVLGSMFAAAVACDPSALPDGIGDSKGITPDRRETLAAEIRAVASVGVAEISVDRIDDPATDMNALTVAAHAEALAEIAGDDATGTVDAGDVNADRFGRRVEDAVADACGASITVDARHGADESDPLVGAASIVAKVERDAHVDRIADRHAGEYDTVGSGYPSDPTTRTFLASYVEDNGALPPCARTTWSTCDDVLAANEQASLGEF